MFSLYLIDLLLHLGNLFIEVLSNCLLMVTEACDLTVTIIIELHTLVYWHLWDSGRIDAMLIFLKELI
jgi:uncharacterized membrane protein YqjE